MNYEMIIEKLTTGKMTMATMIKLQRVVGKKLGSFNVTEKQMAEMSPEDQMEHQVQMLEVVASLVYIAMGSPANMTSDDMAELIPFDKTEEISNAIGKYMNQAADIKKN